LTLTAHEVSHYAWSQMAVKPGARKQRNRVGSPAYVVWSPTLRDFEAPRIRIRVGGVGEVILAGAVSTREARDLVEQVALNVKGIVTVRNELRTDGDLTKQLRNMLEADPRTLELAKDSVVFQGMAELRGSATYDAQVAAMKMAEAIDGVRGVANYAQLAVASQTAGEKRVA
jgi:osmotically-inducible protein OsmY